MLCDGQSNCWGKVAVIMFTKRKFVKIQLEHLYNEIYIIEMFAFKEIILLFA